MQKFKVKIEKEEGNMALVAIEPLEQGYGHTLGNSLRRVMLTTLQGSAITSIKITGVSHQFSTISGVLEDVIQIILNLKKVRIKLFSEAAGRPVRMELKASGKGEVKASQIDTLGQGEVVNGDQHIATLSDAKSKLNIDLTVESGVGYVPADDKKTAEIGVIPIDSIFTPVLSVNYTVDQTRVGRRTDFDN
jgi:DNA-directed RNA polymerase subunit alpha